MTKDIRWQQRFQNFKRAFGLLRDACALNPEMLSDLAQEGIVQRFECTFELGWKVYKDYLDYSGVVLDEATPRKVIKECALRGIFTAGGIDPEMYLEMMLRRNVLSHVYDETRFRQALHTIRTDYFPVLERQHAFFLQKEAALCDG